MAETWRAIADEFALPHLNECLAKAMEQKQELRVDGITVFEQNEQNWMIAGTAVNVMSCWLAAMRDMIAFTEPLPMRIAYS